MLLAAGILIGIIVLCSLVHKMETGEAAGSTYVMFAIVSTLTIVLLVVANNWASQHADEIATAVTTTTEPTYIAVVKNADGSETKYDIKNYETKDGTMTLTLKDGTKVFVPITNIAISEQPSETTTETTQQ